MARRSLLDFTTHTFPAYQPGRFHRVLCSYLDRVARGEIKRLMVFAPPQHGKSEIVSRRFPAFTLGQNPNTRVLGCSYAYSLASGINRDVQRIIDSPSYTELFPETRLNSKQVRANVEGQWLKNADEFEVVQANGSYRSAGVGMGIVGKPASGLLIDDPISGAQDAYSPTYRERLSDWYSTEASTRLSPDGWTVLMHQRWHEDDLAGRLLKRAQEDSRADQWVVVRFPARAYPKTSSLRCPEDWREEGEPLWPERFDDVFLDAKEAGMSPFQWAAVYQQHPQPLEGAHFREKWFRRWEPHEAYWRLDRSRLIECERCQVIVVVDPAASEKQSSDPTAIGAFALTPQNDLLVLESVVKHLAINNIPAEVLAVCRRWKAQSIIFEANGFQVALARECRRTQGMPAVREVQPGSRSKLVRATEAINRCAAGQMYLPEVAPWVAGFVDECVRFTGREGGKDNQVDCLAYAALLQTHKLDQASAGANGVPYMVGR